MIDVPGHERFVRTMVAGATGIDLFLLVVAADDGVMPRTFEHARVLRALGVTRGVVAETKSDLADPTLAAAEADELLAPWATVESVACSARTGAGLDELAQALERIAAGLPSRAADGRPPLLHVDRSFTIHGAGTVVTGTLWSGTIAPGDRPSVLPRGLPVRVRSVEVHDELIPSAAAGQRVALNLAGVKASAIARGDAIGDQRDLVATHILDAELDLLDAPKKGHVIVHHGTRSSTGRLVSLGADRWQLRRAAVARPGRRPRRHPQHRAARHARRRRRPRRPPPPA